jgi:serine/threonine protein kinase
VNQVGRYQILEELGRGACGVVYRALDPAIGRTVAIKSIRFSEFSEPEERRDLRERVLREAQSAGKLSHPNIVTIYDVLESNDLAYIFMEFVDGPSLKDAMRRDAVPGREQVLSFLRQIAEALDYAHRKGIIHRDIKPANIMISDRGVDRDGVAKIADFGVAKLISHEATHQRAFIGTPSYMSPEQLEGVSVGGPSDQFALAVVVYELLTGEKPFVGDNLAALHYQICKRPPKPVNTVNSTLSETVNRVVEHALEKLPEERFASCSEFVGALAVALGECPEWQPVPPVKSEEVEKAAGNGWYAPETVVSSRLLEGGEATGSDQHEELAVLTPVVMPPEPYRIDTALTTRMASSSEREAHQRERGLGPRPDGTKVRIGLEKPAARRFGVTIAACAAVALLAILLVRFLSGPRPGAQGGESARIVSATPPEDLTTANKQSSAPPVDLTTAPPVATPIGTDSSNSSTTVAVRTPVVRNGQAPVPSDELRKPPLRQVAKPVREPTPIALPTHPPTVSMADVEIVSDPPSARVAVDGRSDVSCSTPCSLPLAPGRHTLLAELGGYGNTRKIFSVPISGNVFVSMTRSMGVLLLHSDPEGSTVTVDGRDLGPTPLEVKLAAGRHHLSLSDRGRHHDETIQIDTDGVYARSFRW